MQLLKEVIDSLLYLVFPHACEGCGSDVSEVHNELCLKCLSSLPETNFHLHPNNPIEKIFWGRLPVTYGTAPYYFTKESLMHQLKYKGNKELGVYLGKLMGHALAVSNRLLYVDALIPLPLFPAKERKRGYNQANVLCEGIAAALQKPIFKDVIRRGSYTDSQTKKTGRNAGKTWKAGSH